MSEKWGRAVAAVPIIIPVVGKGQLQLALLKRKRIRASFAVWIPPFRE